MHMLRDMLEERRELKNLKLRARTRWTRTRFGREGLYKKILSGTSQTFGSLQ